MKTRFNILRIIFLVVASTVMLSDETFAADAFVGTNPGASALQEHARADSTTLPVASSANSLFRDVPSLSGRYSTQNMMFLPYIGAGFGAGYNSELDRTFAPNLQPQHNLSPGDLLGPRMIPNEFQMGIRVPF